jgi:hypothetical protein
VRLGLCQVADGNTRGVLSLNQATAPVADNPSSRLINQTPQTDKSAPGLVVGATIASEAGGFFELSALANNIFKGVPAIGGALAEGLGLGMMLIPSKIGSGTTTIQLDDGKRVIYDEDMLSGVIEEKQIDGTWKSTGEIATPEYENNDFFSKITGFTIGSTTYPIDSPKDSSTQFPVLSDRDRQLADPSGGFQAHEGEGIGALVRPYPTDPSLTAPMPGLPADSGVEPVRGMMNERSETGSTPNGVAGNATNGPRLNNQLLAEEVKSGHGFHKHVHENREFENLGITTQEQYQDFVEDIVTNSATEVRYAANGKAFYLDMSTKTVVIKSPNGEATAFRPDYGAYGIGWDDFLDQQVPGPSQSIKNNPSYDAVNNGRTF